MARNLRDSYVKYAPDAVIIKDRHPFVGYSYCPRLVPVEQNQTHHCLVDPALCAQRYFTNRIAGHSLLAWPVITLPSRSSSNSPTSVGL